MYVVDAGIVFWAPFQDSEVIPGFTQEVLAVADMMLVDSRTIPGTGYRRRQDPESALNALEVRIGEVTGHVVLAGYIVFVTHLHKVFCYPTTLPTSARSSSETWEPTELTTFYSTSPNGQFRIRELQGAYQNFAVLTQDGSVLTASTSLLDEFRIIRASSSEGESRTLPSPAMLPSLQGGTTISLAFGDHHFLSLQSNGTVKAYGGEPQRCGALGLGHRRAARWRGINWLDYLPKGEGRTVWFEDLMETWVKDITSKSSIPGNHRDEDIRKAYADYFEEEGAKWEGDLTQEGEMGAYHVLKVAAGGWSSAALVLVDEEKAAQAREAHVVRPKPDRRTTSSASSTLSDDSDEEVESPGEQLSNAVNGIYQCVRGLVRSFLGLTARDARRDADEKRDGRRETTEVEYVWSKQPFPILTDHMRNGEDGR